MNIPANIAGLIHIAEKDPRFKSFTEENKGKTPEEICKKYGVDISLINTIKEMTQWKT